MEEGSGGCSKAEVAVLEEDAVGVTVSDSWDMVKGRVLGPAS